MLSIENKPLNNNKFKFINLNLYIRKLFSVDKSNKFINSNLKPRKQTHLDNYVDNFVYKTVDNCIYIFNQILSVLKIYLYKHIGYF